MNKELVLAGAILGGAYLLARKQGEAEGTSPFSGAGGRTVLNLTSPAPASAVTPPSINVVVERAREAATQVVPAQLSFTPSINVVVEKAKENTTKAMTPTDPTPPSDPGEATPATTSTTGSPTSPIATGEDQGNGVFDTLQKVLDDILNPRTSTPADSGADSLMADFQRRMAQARERAREAITPPQDTRPSPALFEDRASFAHGAIVGPGAYTPPPPPPGYFEPTIDALSLVGDKAKAAYGNYVKGRDFLDRNVVDPTNEFARGVPVLQVPILAIDVVHTATQEVRRLVSDGLGALFGR